MNNNNDIVDLKGNRAVKIPAGPLSNSEAIAINTRDVFVYYNMLNTCEGKLRELSDSKNIDIVEFNHLFGLKCQKYEKLFYNAMRTRFREKMYHDQIKEFNGNYQGVYHPYNPYMQKYHGEYLRSYQLFD